jgi:alpha-galactosidase
MSTRGVVAMSGTFGYELDITKVSDTDRQVIQKLNGDFHKYEDVIHSGDVYRLVSPFDNQWHCACMFVATTSCGPWSISCR